MALILSLETATTVCSVALHSGDKLLGSQSLFIAQSHSERLVPSVKNLVQACGYSIDQLNAVAVSEGPGSYTGLRIGASTAKGLCEALDIPLIAVNTLMAMAFSVNMYVPKDALLCPMIDARRMEVYCLLTNYQLEIIQETQPVIVDESAFEEFLNKGNIYFFGNGSAKCKNVIGHKNAIFIDNVETDAVSVGALANHKFLEEEFEDVAYFNPFYLKDFRVTKPKAK